MHCFYLVGMIINTKQFTAVIYANAYMFNTALLSYFQTGHVTAMAQAPGKQLTPAVCHLWAGIFTENSGITGLNRRDITWFDR